VSLCSPEPTASALLRDDRFDDLHQRDEVYRLTGPTGSTAVSGEVVRRHSFPPPPVAEIASAPHTVAVIDAGKEAKARSAPPDERGVERVTMLPAMTSWADDGRNVDHSGEACRRRACGVAPVCDLVRPELERPSRPLRSCARPVLKRTGYVDEDRHVATAFGRQAVGGSPLPPDLACAGETRERGHRPRLERRAGRQFGSGSSATRQERARRTSSTACVRERHSCDRVSTSSPHARLRPTDPRPDDGSSRWRPRERYSRRMSDNGRSA